MLETKLIIWPVPKCLNKYPAYKEKYIVTTCKDIGVGNKLGKKLFSSNSRKACEKFIRKVA